MTIAIRYCSRTGNTAKVAQEMATALHVEARSIEAPLPLPVDDLFLGGAIHMATMDRELKEFVANLAPGQVGQVFMFGTSGGVMSIARGLAHALKERHIKVASAQLFLHGMMPDKKALSDDEKAKIAAFIHQAAAELTR
ncbi:flavodoxin family protein [Lacticaseibacillus jixianensis]|uniref:Flavodoxin family protein n=1 Tax=Lacticaseibacillus jixianensis TaxID=2486012 RepID=A0ABW4B8I7_9LACO|nr:flavodoxin domain-containing protein [Lacticaseibacillus jixianensis]